jgi:diguanylate cyclase (GGDEF)-like protein
MGLNVVAVLYLTLTLFGARTSLKQNHLFLISGTLANGVILNVPGGLNYAYKSLFYILVTLFLLKVICNFKLKEAFFSVAIFSIIDALGETVVALISVEVFGYTVTYFHQHILLLLFGVLIQNTINISIILLIRTYKYKKDLASPSTNNPALFILLMLLTAVFFNFVGLLNPSLNLKTVVLYNAIIVSLLLICSILFFYLIDKLRKGVGIDTLTGLWNRQFFHVNLQEELERTNRTGNPTSLAIIDVDNFKKINDTFGHLAGDVALKKIANTLRQNVRRIDTVVRWGGEEFAIVFSNADIETAYEVVERIRKSVEAIEFMCQITISIGLSSTNLTTNLDELVHVADKALYRAKETKNTTIIFVEAPSY